LKISLSFCYFAVFSFAVTVNIISLPNSTNQPHVLWSSWQKRACISSYGHIG
jgi:hypothetical protein